MYAPECFCCTKIRLCLTMKVCRGDLCPTAVKGVISFSGRVTSRSRPPLCALFFLSQTEKVELSQLLDDFCKKSPWKKYEIFAHNYHSGSDALKPSLSRAIFKSSQYSIRFHITVSLFYVSYSKATTFINREIFHTEPFHKSPLKTFLPFFTFSILPCLLTTVQSDLFIVVFALFLLST